jgi:phospholipid/cholesterol/gamma-HCH transport system substrate-binding protein
MNERQMQFRVGVVVFATMIIGGLLATLNEPLLTSWLPWGRTTYGVGIRMEEAPGVAENTPVRKNGILIGRVEAIEDQKDHVVLKVRIDADRPLFAEYEPIVRTTVLGDATIDFKTIPLPDTAERVPDGYEFAGKVAPNPFDAIADFASLKEEFERAANSLADAGDQVSRLAERVNEAFGDETQEGRVGRLLDTTERAMTQFASTMTAFNEIIGDVPAGGQPAGALPLDGQPRFRAQPPLDGQPPAGMPPQGVQPPGVRPQPGLEPPVEGPELRRRLRAGLNELPDAIREFRQTLELADRNLRNLEGFTEPLGQKGTDIAEALIRAVDGVDRLVEDFNVLVQALNNREGTIGRLIHDAQAYENLNRLMCNANTVLGQVYELAQRLRPVVEDARVLMDKLAREPGRVLTGGLNPSPIK